MFAQHHVYHKKLQGVSSADAIKIVKDSHNLDFAKVVPENIQFGTMFTWVMTEVGSTRSRVHGQPAINSYRLSDDLHPPLQSSAQ